MTKALKVLAECVDARNGKRFKPGDVFQPAPSVEQAKRLVAANCLPQEAIDIAVSAESEAEAAAEETAKRTAEQQAAKDAAEAEAKLLAEEQAAKDAADEKKTGGKKA